MRHCYYHYTFKSQKKYLQFGGLLYFLHLPQPLKYFRQLRQVHKVYFRFFPLVSYLRHRALPRCGRYCSCCQQCMCSFPCLPHSRRGWPENRWASSETWKANSTGVSPCLHSIIFPRLRPFTVDPVLFHFLPLPPGPNPLISEGSRGLSSVVKSTSTILHLPYCIYQKMKV